MSSSHDGDGRRKLRALAAWLCALWIVCGACGCQSTDLVGRTEWEYRPRAQPLTAPLSSAAVLVTTLEDRRPPVQRDKLWGLYALPLMPYYTNTLNRPLAGSKSAYDVDGHYTWRRFRCPELVDLSGKVGATSAVRDALCAELRTANLFGNVVVGTDPGSARAKFTIRGEIAELSWSHAQICYCLSILPPVLVLWGAGLPMDYGPYVSVNVALSLEDSSTGQVLWKHVCRGEAGRGARGLYYPKGPSRGPDDLRLAHDVELCLVALERALADGVSSLRSWLEANPGR